MKQVAEMWLFILACFAVVLAVVYMLLLSSRCRMDDGNWFCPECGAFVVHEDYSGCGCGSKEREL